MTKSGRGPSCPECGKSATGNFCQHCGARLGGRFCNECGSEVAAGARFCNQCGTEVAGGAAGAGAGRAGEHRAAARAAFGGQNLPWWIAGAAMFVMIMLVGRAMVRPAGPVAPGGAPPAAPVGGGRPAGTPPDLSQMTPIEAATRLFNRVMTATSAGDSAQAQAFLPMAIAAYDLARPLDHDALFHLSVLNRTARNLDAALDNALEILEDDPNHLLALAAAAEAEIELGLPEEAEKHYRHIFEIYDTESRRPLQEYSDHSAIVQVLKQDAERYLAGR